MKALIVLSLAAAAAMLNGCAVVPVEPYGPPAVAYGPPPVVVLKPAYPVYRYHRYYGGRGYRYWR